jgi:hypothetical protein
MNVREILTPTEQLILSVLDAQGEHTAAWQRYDITGNDNEAEIYCSTNDDDDDGFPDGVVTEWIEEGFQSIGKALKRTGVCRYGISGVAVIVTVNGKPYA